MLCSHVANGQEKLYKQEPFDTIYLKTQEVPLKVFPDAFPSRQIPSSPKPGTTFRIRMLSKPDQEFDVQWGNVRKVELFEQSLLKQAAAIVSEADVLTRRKSYEKAQEKFDEAFEYLAFLNEKYPRTRGLNKVTENFLIQEAKKLLANKEYERAWFLLHEAYEKNPGKKGLTAGLTLVLDRMFNASIRKRDFVDARRIFSVTQERYGSDLKSLLDKWRTRMEQFGKRLLELAEKKLAEKKFRDSYIASRRLIDLWPETPGALEFTKKIGAVYPIVSVGVTHPYHPDSKGNFNDRGKRRTSRLLERRLFEMTEVGTEGGVYSCPFGTANRSEDGLKVDVQLNQLKDHDASVSGLSLARQLRRRADPNSPEHDTLWAYLYDQVNVRQVYDLDVKLDRPCLRIESMLSLPLTDSSSQQTTKLAPYVVSPDSTPDQTVFLANEDYIAKTESYPREIIERRFANSQLAMNALRRGEIDAVARFLPAEMRMLKNDRSIKVGSYRIPSTHFLIPNAEKKFPASRAFRAALSYGINRERILKREIMGGVDIKGCRIISGPFAPGIGNNDPIGYAYDNSQTPRAFDSILARIRLELAKIEAANAAKKAGEEAPAVPKLVLAHPDDEIARLASKEIADSWIAMGLEVELRVIPAGKSRLTDDNWDFMYTDVVVEEPLTEASRLLGSDGFAGCGSPYLNLALRQLHQADNWNTAGRRLKAIHQACFDDVSVIPLWQLVDHFAVRADLQGVGEQPVRLYQNIENWQVESR